MMRCARVLRAVPFKYVPLIPHVSHDDTPFRLLTRDYVTELSPSSYTATTRHAGSGDKDATVTTSMSAADALPSTLLRVDARALTLLAHTAFDDIEHLLRPAHLASLRRIFDAPDASDNDRFVALTLLRNACVAAGRALPGCQDTGTAIIAGYRGQNVFVTGDEAEALSRGVYDVFQQRNLRYSQNVPLSMYDEANTGTNLPAQIDLYATRGSAYEFMFIAKGGGSANKSYLFQETKSVLNPKSLRRFLEDKLALFGTAACPPYHVAVVIGGTSAEQTMKTVKYASCKYYDHLPTQPDHERGYTYRDVELEAEVLRICNSLGMGAQFGGKYYAHDARVVRMPRHGASCPIGIGVSCSADRQVLGRIDAQGVWLEQLETDPARYLPDVREDELFATPAVAVDLTRPMSEIRRQLSQYPVKTRLSLTGTIVVARDMAHAKIQEMLNKGEPLPDYMKQHPIYYAGPAKTPEGLPSGSFGPTTAGRMDSYVDPFMAAGGSYVTLAKGNRSKVVTDACKKHGGFYLGSIGGPAAILAKQNIKKVECLAFPELGMEAVWRIEVVNFPAFIVVDDKGNDFFAQLKPSKQ